MPQRQYLVRSLQNGTIRTVTARSHRAALDAIDPGPGKYEVKERGANADDWRAYKVS